MATSQVNKKVNKREKVENEVNHWSERRCHPVTSLSIEKQSN
jgi:hypothetical protein